LSIRKLNKSREGYGLGIKDWVDLGGMELVER